MSTTSTRVRRVTRAGAAVAAGGAAAAAAAVLAAPAATAVEPGSATVNPGLSFGSTSAPYGTSCTYTVSATASWWGDAYFNVRAPDGSWHYLGRVSDLSPHQVATIDWTPSHGPGSYTIAVNGAGYGVATTSPQVGTGVNLGSMCFVF